ncbi:MAG: hypothetical protein HY447_03615 [Candidatus Omnitrophica bacterium]|nr:hypothetical protein [Candidatus Omnitrophota bacterium]
METIHLRFDNAFVEEVVFLEMRREEEGNCLLAKSFYDQRDKIYEETKTEEERDERFRSFYTEWFQKLGLSSIFKEIILQFPLILQTKPLIFVKRAWTKKDEETELYDEEGKKTVLIRLQAIRINDRSWLQAYLRSEFMRTSDMLDPVFQYSPRLDLGGESELENELVRERFHVLWNLYIDARMRRRGWKTVFPTETRGHGFEKARDQFTQYELLQLARDERNAPILS